jgi:predicted PurR-regulated permease PerM
MNNTKAWILVIGILVVMAGVAIAMVVIAGQAAQQVVSPLQEANDFFQTEVAGVLHPTPTIIPDPVTIIHEIRSLARLETIQYSVEKVITADQR